MNSLRLTSFAAIALFGFIITAAVPRTLLAQPVIKAPDTVAMTAMVGSRTSQYVTVTNETDSQRFVMIGSAWLDTMDFPPFVDSVLLAAGTNQRASFTVWFAPKSAGTFVEMVYLQEAFSSELDSIILIGTGVQRQPLIVTTSGSIADAGLTDTVCETMTLRNPYPSGQIKLKKIETGLAMGYMLDMAGLSLPYTLYGDSSVSFGICFTNRGQYHAYDSLGIEYEDIDQSSRGLNLALNTLVHGNVPDTSSIPLGSDSATVNITASGPGPVEQIVSIVNNTGTRLKMDNIQLEYSGWNEPFDAVIVSPDSACPFYVPDGGVVLVGICLVDTAMGTFNDTLYINSEPGIASQKKFVPTGTGARAIYIHATRTASGVVEQSDATVPPIADPNPTAESTFLSFTTASAGNVKIEVFDALGNKVTGGFSGTLAAGNHTEPVSLVNLPAGVYYARIQTEAGTKTIKLVKE